MNKYDEFWQQTKQALAAIPLDLQRRKQDTPLHDIRVERISFKSLLNETVHGLLLLPEGKGPFPIVLEYLGYMNHIQEPWNFSHWLQIGCGCFVIDNRGQNGKTLDSVAYQGVKGKMPLGRGFQKPADFYMRRLYGDSLRMIDVVYQLAEVDKKRIILRGGSQGGGVALMVNALSEKPIFATFADVPSHSNIIARIKEGTGSYQVIHQYLQRHPAEAQQIYETMKYFDCQYFVDKIKNPVFTSVGSADPICPMKDFFPTYHRITAKKTLQIYLNKGHGGGESKQISIELSTIKKLLQESKYENCNL